MSKKGEQKGSDLLRHLKNGGVLAPVYYIFGDDPYVVRELIGALKERIQPAFKDFNLQHVTAGEVEGDKIASLAQQLPVMDSSTMVFVREAQLLKKNDWDGLTHYLEDPSPTTCLVFLDPGATAGIDKRTKVGKILGKLTVGCSKPYDNQMPRWVEERGKRHRVRIRGDATYRLLELLGTDLSSLDNALERISLYLGGKGEATIELIDELIAENRTYNIFDLSEFIGHRNLQDALRLLRGLLDTGEVPLKILALMARAFRMLLKARAEVEQGAGQREMDKYIPRQLRFNREERVRQFYQQVRRFTAPELGQAMLLIQQTDFSLKSTSGLTPELIMERLVIELCQLRVYA